MGQKEAWHESPLQKKKKEKKEKMPEGANEVKSVTKLGNKILKYPTNASISFFFLFSLSAALPLSLSFLDKQSPGGDRAL